MELQAVMPCHQLQHTGGLACLGAAPGPAPKHTAHCTLRTAHCALRTAHCALHTHHHHRSLHQRVGRRHHPCASSAFRHGAPAACPSPAFRLGTLRRFSPAHIVVDDAGKVHQQRAGRWGGAERWVHKEGGQGGGGGLLGVGPYWGTPPCDGHRGRVGGADRREQGVRDPPGCPRPP
jgi:hypothetical protein